MANRHVLKLLAAVGAMLLPLGAVVATAPGASAAVTVPVRANAGGSALTDAAGDQWVADKAYSSGDWGYQTSYGSGSTGGAIAGTTDDSLYQNYNTFNGWGGYRFDVPNGTYQVTLKMVEDWANAAGQRKFDVRVEGVNALTAFDIFASCGALTACDRTFPATVSDGALNVQFNMNGGANYATVSAISVTGGGGGDTTPPSVPGNLRSTATSSTSVSLAWNASTDNVAVTGYEIYRGTTLITTVTGTTHTDTGLTPATAYTYTVRARDAAGNRSTASTQLNVTTQDGGGGDGNKLLGYFTQWGIYQRAYHVKNIVTSGSAAKLTHINYAFGNVQNGQCTLGDTYADYDRFYQAGESVDGVADTWDNGALRGNFNQLRKLKKQFPNIKVLFSFGGWTWSGGFGQAAANPAAFAESCYRLVEDPRWADVFDGIDIDWEYPNACGLTCDTSGFSSFKNLMSALRSRFGSSYLVTAAITADATSGGKIDAADYGGAAQYLDWYNVMTYDFFGAWAAQGPTAPHSPLNTYSGIPITGFDSDSAIQKLKSKGVPASKLLLGIGFYGRGWTGVTQATPGGTATGAAPGTYEAGNEDYNQWWSYDTPATIGGKMSYSKNQGLGGAFFWELTGDTSNGELISAMKSGLG
ncbi:glycosyl hydrolase family 18 protein [Streptosporangium roseum]|uniref:glycosyl hydrolase family 18 protein n=1 Tax=Streptosporangium roseum TaxID=2001 RepID=UPI0004CD565A|nr:glycosyl hydrolase family 18 protein [Streptosporangium roseum]